MFNEKELSLMPTPIFSKTWLWLGKHSNRIGSNSCYRCSLRRRSSTNAKPTSSLWTTFSPGCTVVVVGIESARSHTVGRVEQETRRLWAERIISCIQTSLITSQDWSLCRFDNELLAVDRIAASRAITNGDVDLIVRQDQAMSEVSAQMGILFRGHSGCLGHWISEFW